MRRYCNRRKGGKTMVCFAAFGCGLVTCCVLPPKVLVILLGAALILCGVSCGKR